jgi:hypothetical protein
MSDQGEQCKGAVACVGSCMRTRVFISHANPEDNAFALWLTMQLTRLGYRVWCDLTRLLGGEDFWKEAEAAIREDTAKFIYVLSRVSNTKDGPLQELSIARKVAKENGLKDFVIPVLIDDLQPSAFNAELTRLNTIFCKPGWANVIHPLLKKLEEDGVQRDESRFSVGTVGEWWKKYVSQGTTVAQRSEQCISNWFEVTMPEKVYFHRPRLAVLAGGFDPLSLSYPAVEHGGYVVCFAPSKDMRASGRTVADVSASFTLSTRDMMEGKNLPESLNVTDARNIVTALLRIVWEKAAEKRGLRLHKMANDRKAFYVTKSLLGGKMMISLGSPIGPIRKRLIGYKTLGRRTAQPSRRFWHYAVSAKPILWPACAYVISSHVVFSSDEEQAWTNSHNMHKARRSQCAEWWNDDWRDRMLLTMGLLRDADGRISVQVGDGICVSISDWPLCLDSPVSYKEPEGRVMSVLGSERGDESANDDTEGTENEGRS